MEQSGGGFVPPVPATPGVQGAEASVGLPGPEPPHQLQSPDAGGLLPVVRSVGFCALMLIGSFGLWGFAWVWHTAQEVSPRVKRAVGEGTWSPGARTGLVWVPLVGLIVVYQSWRDISHFATQAGTKTFSPGGYLAGYVVVSLLPLLSILAIAFPWVVQEKLNDAWRASEPQRAAKAPMMQADWITLGIGLAIWGIGLVSVLAS